MQLCDHYRMSWANYRQEVIFAKKIYLLEPLSLFVTNQCAEVRKWAGGRKDTSAGTAGHWALACSRFAGCQTAFLRTGACRDCAAAASSVPASKCQRLPAHPPGVMLHRTEASSAHFCSCAELYEVWASQACRPHLCDAIMLQYSTLGGWTCELSCEQLEFRCCLHYALGYSPAGQWQCLTPRTAVRKTGHLAWSSWSALATASHYLPYINVSRSESQPTFIGSDLVHTYTCI